MKGQFYMHFETMPKGTAQQKGVYVRNGRPYFYTKDKVENAKALFMAELFPHRPKKPVEGPVKLTVFLHFDVKNKSLWGKPKTTKPDLDNEVKLLIDVFADLKFFAVGDQQITSLHLIKRWGPKPTVDITIEPLEVIKTYDTV